MVGAMRMALALTLLLMLGPVLVEAESWLSNLGISSVDAATVFGLGFGPPVFQSENAPPGCGPYLNPPRTPFMARQNCTYLAAFSPWVAPAAISAICASAAAPAFGFGLPIGTCDLSGVPRANASNATGAAGVQLPSPITAFASWFGGGPSAAAAPNTTAGGRQLPTLVVFR